MSVFDAIRLYRDHVERPDCVLSPWARSLWATLASHVDHAGVCYPGMPVLRVALKPSDDGKGASADTVQRAQAELVAYGVLDLVAAHGRGRRSQYRLALADPLEETPPASGVYRRSGNAAVQRRLRPVDDVENAAVQPENAAVQRSHIGEVGREVEEGSSIDDDTETPPCSGVSEDVETASWAAEIIARHYAGQVKTRKRKAS